MGHVEFPISRSEDGSYVTLLTEDQMSARLWCSADWTAENILKSATIPVGSAIMSALTAGYLFLNSKKKTLLLTRGVLKRTGKALVKFYLIESSHFHFLKKKDWFKAHSHRAKR